MLSITEKYNLLYVRREAWQAGGALWPRMAGQLTASLLIAQVVLFLLLASVCSAVVPLSPWYVQVSSAPAACPRDAGPGRIP